MKRILILIILTYSSLLSQSLFEDLKKAVELGKPELYSQIFVDNKKEIETEWFEENIIKRGFKKVEVAEPYFSSNEGVKKGILQILLKSEIENELQIWEIQMEGEKISEKKIVKRVPELYEVQIPSKRIERAKEVSLLARDIDVVFKNAIVFWDNLPINRNTAVIIYGDGILHFYPSSREERHQVSINFGSSEILTPIKWLYVRFSPLNLQKYFKIVEPIKINPPHEIYDKASEIFSQFSSLSFSIELPAFKKILFTLPSPQEILIESIEGKLGEFTYNFSTLLEENITFMDRKREKILCLYSPDEEKIRIKFSSTSLWNLLHEDIYLDFNPGDEFLNIKAKLLLESKEDDIDSLFLRLNNSFEIKSITEKNSPVLFMRDNQGLLSIFLSKRYRKGETLELSLDYSGKIYGEIELVDIQTEKKPSPRKIGRERKLQDRFSMLKENRKEPFYLYSYTSLWHPLRTEWDFFTANITIKVPNGFTAISNGNLVRKEGNTFFWEERVPVKYLSVVIGRFYSYTDFESKIPIKFFVTMESGYPDIDFKRVKIILKFFSSLYGEYPYEKLYVIKRKWNTLGGHSPASFIILNTLIKGLIPKSSPGDLSSDVREYFLVHEIAHQWWGNIVTGRSYRDVCIPEGISQFSTFLYIKDFYGDRVFYDIIKRIITWINKKSTTGSISLGTRVGHFSDDSDAFLAVIYDKSALALYLLQRILGREVLIDSLREVLDKYSYSDISIGELRKVIERKSGTDLGKFFSGWFYNYTLPEVEIYWKNENLNGKNYLILKVVQKGETEFVFPLPIQWKDNQIMRNEELLVSKKEEVFKFSLEGKASSLKVNKPKIVPGKFRVFKER
jgi:hypothetical protein